MPVSCAPAAWGLEPSACALRQVITERSEDHGVQSMWLATSTGPSISIDVRELRTPLDPALRPVVGAHPESHCALDQGTSICSAGTESAGENTGAIRGQSLAKAAGVAEMGRSVTDVLLGDRVEIPSAAGVFNPGIQVDVDLRTVPFERAKTLVAADQIELPVALDRGVGESTSAVTSLLHRPPSRALQCRDVSSRTTSGRSRRCRRRPSSC